MIQPTKVLMEVCSFAVGGKGGKAKSAKDLNVFLGKVAGRLGGRPTYACIHAKNIARKFHTPCSVQPCVITLQAKPSCADHMVLEPKFPCNVTCIITLQSKPSCADSCSSTKVFM